FERADVGDYLFGEVALVLSLFNVGALEALDVSPIEYRRHRSDRFELVAYAIELAALEHPRRTRGSVTILLEDVPATKDDIIEIRQRNELVDLRGASFGPLSQADRAHLRQ